LEVPEHVRECSRRAARPLLIGGSAARS
jgi:hypothetical protein